MKRAIALYKKEMPKLFPGFFLLPTIEQDILKKANEGLIKKHFTLVCQKEWFFKPMSEEEYEILHKDNGKTDKKYCELERKFALDGLKLHRENLLRVLLCGIGDAYFYFNETFEPNKSELSFDTIYDYDVDDYIYQQRMIKEFGLDKQKESDDHYKSQYKLRLNGKWARCHFNKEVENKVNLYGQYYITIYSLSTYIYFLLEDIFFSLSTKEHSKVEQLRGQIILGEFSQKLEDELADIDKDIVWIDDDTSDNNNRKLSIIIPNISTAKKIRLQHFHEDLISNGTRNKQDLNDITAHYTQLFNNEINISLN